MALHQTLTPARVDLVIPQGTTWYVPLRVWESGSPVDAAAVRRLADTTGWTASMKVRSSPESSTVQLDCSTANGRLEVGFSPPKWAAAASISAADLIVPTTLNGFCYQAGAGGTLGSAEPTAWPVVLGQSVVNGVTLTCKRDDSIVSNVRIVVPVATTAALVDWGVGVYDLELINPFGHVTRLLHGSCQLSREISR